MSRRKGKNLASGDYAIVAYQDSIRYFSEYRWTRVKESLNGKHVCEGFDTLPVSVKVSNGMLVQKESFFRSYFNSK